MNIRFAEISDRDWIAGHDPHIAPTELENLLALRRVLVCEEEGQRIGWLRWNLFWDNTPFLNMIFLLPGFRRRGFGRAMLEFWTSEMAAQGYTRLLTSTQSNEEAQHFYRAQGYADAGALLLPGEAAELFFQRELNPESAQKFHIHFPGFQRKRNCNAAVRVLKSQIFIFLRTACGRRGRADGGTSDERKQTPRNDGTHHNARAGGSVYRRTAFRAAGADRK